MEQQDRAAHEERARDGDDQKGGAALVWIGLAALAMIAVILLALR